MNTTDALTGLSNYIAYSRAVASAPAGCEIVLFDIDHLGRFLYAYGIHAADELVRSIAQSIDATAQHRERSAYRVGGDEFVMIVANGHGIECAVEAQAAVAELVPVRWSPEVPPSYRASVSAVACIVEPRVPEHHTMLLSRLGSALEEHKVTAGRGAPPAWCKVAA